MRNRFQQTILIPIACCALTLMSAVATAGNSQLPASDSSILSALVDSETRSNKARARNKYRHPLQTLEFFEVSSDMTVVEIWPGGQGGWYRSILEPYLAGNGSYIPVKSGDDFPLPTTNVPNEIADRVLVFRAHGFMIYDHPAAHYFAAIYRMLKPGGIFGIVDHRGNEAVPQDPKGKSGYVNQSHVLGLAKNAGFVLLEKSEINANPLDTRDHPKGLYSLPPTLRGSALNKERREKMLLIGESDRMTLKFVKPQSQ